MRLRLARAAGSTVQVAVGSITQRLATDPGRDRAALVAAVGRVEAGDGRRLPAQQGEEPGQRQVQLGEGQGQRRLQPQHARRSLVEGEVLELGGVGGVVGGDGVDGPVGQARP